MKLRDWLLLFILVSLFLIGIDAYTHRDNTPVVVQPAYMTNYIENATILDYGDGKFDVAAAKYYFIETEGEP